MDGDSKKLHENLEKTNARKRSNYLLNDSDVSESTRFRYSFLFDTTMDQFLLAYNNVFLPWCGLFCWAIFLFS
jgi:hypothetical protein